ncbi:two-component system response regulator UvrY [Marinobacter panjinensis]|uniref:Two-component system response regulator UvrY n=1 Tax=Marinobacter panjinensis TaxID=2576384 RepID=A0A4U6R3G3_9GAMM|nr:UvrY/SirA/GacA family response regulator transcription factor [Marinobacter panjinensis]MCR8915641.1 UvrY/SirA/GacA family response regulator transcription factor [Marinobacter panjinensis]TKV66886.1 two-component system response regulator UvrY [Marinobacter panjinensis]
MIRVLVVDDHELVRSGISRMLADNPDIDVIGEASSGEEAIDFVRKDSPDIVLMDIRMPGIGGLEATRRILRIDDAIRVIVVTACADDPYPTRVMQAGASAYITKGADIKEMVRAIRMAHSGQRYISPEIAQKMALKQLGGGDARDEDGELTLFDRLSEREMQIALMVVDCQKVQDISDKLCLSPKTVNSYRYRIFEKLEISSDVELALMAVRLGLLDADRA